MALPSNTFMFNYNAKEYDAVNHKLPKNTEQILDFDIVFTGTPQTVGEDYLYFGTSTSNGLFNNCMISYGSQSANPFNRDNSSNRTITIVYKTSGYTSDSTNIFANRDNNVGSRMNWMVRGDRYHTNDNTFLQFVPSADPQIIVIRVSSDGSSVRKSIDVSGNTLQITSGTANFGTASSTFEFFRGGWPNEDFNSYFFWMYCSLEALTDEEILDVVWYNEGINQKTATGITINSLSWTTDIPGTGGTGTSANCTYSVVVDYDDETSETNPSSLKVYGSITAGTNQYHNRQVVGDLELSFVDGAITATTSVTAYQSGYFDINQIPTNNMFRNGVNLNYQQPKPHDYSKDYMTINVISGGTIEWIHGTGTTAMNILYSKDNGANWTTIASTTAGTSISVDAGDKVLFKGDNERYMVSGKTNRTYANKFLLTGCTVDIEGNIMSMTAGDNFTAATSVASYAFSCLFANNPTGIRYSTNLVLPATTLTEGCYGYMFEGCTSLTTAPALPATTLGIACYESMFYNCTSLTTAPALPATTLVTWCYNSMFGYCTNLNYIKCLATNISANWCTYDWVRSVAATGTFVKASSMTGWTTGNKGIPSGWTVQEV